MRIGLTMKSKLMAWLMVALLLWLTGCGGAPPLGEPPPGTVITAPVPASPATPDKIVLEEALQGRHLSGAEVADLSDRLLTDGHSAWNDQQTMARLELLLLKSLKTQDKTHRPVLWRNLGIIHYHQKKYKQARQELQASNELNPRNARTHFYLALLFGHQGEIYDRQGKRRISRQQYKRAAIEMEQARKLDPRNPLYRQDIKEILEQEPRK
jgi:tetratricopeptide (TPR) repeat protein/predicted small lipoprotein YifL